jgi:hypothetical protein
MPTLYVVKRTKPRNKSRALLRHWKEQERWYHAPVDDAMLARTRGSIPYLGYWDGDIAPRR